MEKEIECPQCEGTGLTEQFAGGSCGVRTSECCGGCYVDVECDECNGSGTILDDEDEE